MKQIEQEEDSFSLSKNDILKVTNSALKDSSIKELSKDSDLEEVTIGQANKAYIICDEDRKYFIRITNKDKGLEKFEKEKQAKEIARKAGVKVPEIIVIDSFSINNSDERNKGYDVAFELSEYIEGGNFSQIFKKLNPLEKESVSKQFVEELSKLHGIKVLRCNGGIKQVDERNSIEIQNMKEFLQTHSVRDG